MQTWKAAVLLQIKDILLLTALEQLVSVALLSCNCTHKGWLWRQNTALETVGCPQWNRHLKFWPLLVLQRLPEHNKTGKCPVQSHCPVALSAVFGYNSVQTLKSGDHIRTPPLIDVIHIKEQEKNSLKLFRAIWVDWLTHSLSSLSVLGLLLQNKSWIRHYWLLFLKPVQHIT